MLEFGICALELGGNSARKPEMESELWENGAALMSWYRAGGEPLCVSETSARLLWDYNGLYIKVSCEVSPQERTDYVEFAIQPSHYSIQDFDKVTVWRSGAMKGVSIRESAGSRLVEEFGTSIKRREPIEMAYTGYEAAVCHETDRWTAMISIPWETIGGIPSETFGLQCLRVRPASGEVLCPYPLDTVYHYNGKLEHPMDFIEASLGGTPKTIAYPGVLATLPSGIRRWQRPARLDQPSREGQAELWSLMHRLPEPTTPETLESRVGLAQLWQNVLVLEGFDFHVDMAHSYPWKQIHPWSIRRQVNEALRHGNPAAACGPLDELLQFFNLATRWWFADQSPGNLREEEWITPGELFVAEQDDNRLVLHFRTGLQPLRLCLTFPSHGGIRLAGLREGFFQPKEVLPFELTEHSTQDYSAIGNGIEVHLRTGIDWSIKSGPWQLNKGGIWLRIHPIHGILAVEIRGDLHFDEAVYGFGERFESLNHRGRILSLWQRDCYEGLITGLRNHAYKNIPLLHSSRGYSLFWNSTYRLRADVGHDDESRYKLTSSGSILDLYVWPCKPLEAIRRYTSLTGKPLLPPKWAFEPWAGGTGKRWKNGESAGSVEEVIRVMRKFRSLDIPHSAVYAEGTPADERLFDAMNELGVRVLNWYFPIIRESVAREALADNTDLELPYVKYLDGQGKEGYLDFSHPNVMTLLRAFWKKKLDLGTAGTMIDFGDLIPDSARFYDGRTGDEMHNFFSYDYARRYRELFREWRGDDFVLFQRAAAPGTQSFTGLFGGDVPSSFIGLKASVYAGLGIASCGFPFWGSDLGGFKGFPDEDLYIRWVQFGAFSPFMRVHGTDPREPWVYSEFAVNIYKRYAWLRYNLLDYAYSHAVHAHRTGEPMMRTMPLAYPDESFGSNAETQYMYGSELLVAPVVEESGQVGVRLPSGRWVSLWEGLVYEGPHHLAIHAPLDMIPVFIREGAVIPLQLNADTLMLGDSLTTGALQALLVTKPVPDSAAHREIHHHAHAASMVSLTLSGNKFVIVLEGEYEPDLLLVAGLPLHSQATINCDSERLTGQWVNNRLAIRLPKSPHVIQLILTTE